jgi:hypothetical protein
VGVRVRVRVSRTPKDPFLPDINTCSQSFVRKPVRHRCRQMKQWGANFNKQQSIFWKTERNALKNTITNY